MAIQIHVTAPTESLPDHKHCPIRHGQLGTAFWLAILAAYSLLSTILATPSYNGPDSDRVAIFATTGT